MLLLIEQPTLSRQPTTYRRNKEFQTTTETWIQFLHIMCNTVSVDPRRLAIVCLVPQAACGTGRHIMSLDTVDTWPHCGTLFIPVTDDTRSAARSAILQWGRAKEADLIISSASDFWYQPLLRSQFRNRPPTLWATSWTSIFHPQNGFYPSDDTISRDADICMVWPSSDPQPPATPFCDGWVVCPTQLLLPTFRLEQLRRTVCIWPYTQASREQLRLNARWTRRIALPQRYLAILYPRLTYPDPADRTDPADSSDPTDRTDSSDPTDRTDSSDPTDDSRSTTPPSDEEVLEQLVTQMCEAALEGDCT